MKFISVQVLLLGLLLQVSFGQQIDKKEVNIKESTSAIEIDGILDEAAWDDVEPARDFFQTFPYDSALSTSQCEIFLTYNKENLYIGMKCNDVDPESDFVMISQRRDYRRPGIESVNLIFDTFRDQTNAYSFGINPYGVQREGLVANGGSSPGDFSLDWDNKWFGESNIGEDFWSAELAIPFKTIEIGT